MICNMPRCGGRADHVATRGGLAVVLCGPCAQAIESGFGVRIRALVVRLPRRRGA